MFAGYLLHVFGCEPKEAHSARVVRRRLALNNLFTRKIAAFSHKILELILVRRHLTRILICACHDLHVCVYVRCMYKGKV